jgi:hypothetical protein
MTGVVIQGTWGRLLTAYYLGVSGEGLARLVENIVHQGLKFRQQRPLADAWT